jgi:hypothetical protein
VKLFQEMIDLLKELSKKDDALKIKALPMVEGLSNYLIKTQGLLDGLVKGGLATKKAAIEGDLQAWIAAAPERKAAYGGVIERMAKLTAEQQATREQDALLEGVARMVNLLGAADTIVQMAEERPKPTRSATLTSRSGTGSAWSSSRWRCRSATIPRSTRRSSSCS